MAETQTLDVLLELYQKTKARGEWASLLMETKNGKDTITFRIGNVPAGSSAETGTPATNSKKTKTPSQFRRDQKRKDQFLAKKNLDAKDSPLRNSESGSGGLTKVNLVEPRDEIELETPEANESLVETEVNYVGEYVYDTKLERDDIHKEFWKKWNGNFKEGVKEFSDGSTCNEKILIFWGKCSFKEGFNRSYLLDKKNWPKEVKKVEIEDPG